MEKCTIFEEIVTEKHCWYYSAAYHLHYSKFTIHSTKMDQNDVMTLNHLVKKQTKNQNNIEIF